MLYTYVYNNVGYKYYFDVFCAIINMYISANST